MRSTARFTLGLVLLLLAFGTLVGRAGTSASSTPTQAERTRTELRLGGHHELERSALLAQVLRPDSP